MNRENVEKILDWTISGYLVKIQDLCVKYAKCYNLAIRMHDSGYLHESGVKIRVLTDIVDRLFADDLNIVLCTEVDDEKKYITKVFYTRNDSDDIVGLISHVES